MRQLGRRWSRRRVSWLVSDEGFFEGEAYAGVHVEVFGGRHCGRRCSILGIGGKGNYSVGVP